MYSYTHPLTMQPHVVEIVDTLQQFGSTESGTAQAERTAGIGMIGGLALFNNDQAVLQLNQDERAVVARRLIGYEVSQIVAETKIPHSRVSFAFDRVKTLYGIDMSNDGAFDRFVDPASELMVMTRHAALSADPVQYDTDYTILKGVATGKSNISIGQDLKIKSDAIRDRTEVMKYSLNTHSRRALGVAAVFMGLTDKDVSDFASVNQVVEHYRQRPEGVQSALVYERPIPDSF